MTEGASSAPATDRRRDIPLAVISVGMAVVVWWPAFTLGAWGVLFFDTLLTLWVAATAALVFVLFERRPVRSRVWRATLLLLPSVWLAFSFVDFETTDLLATSRSAETPSPGAVSTPSSARRAICDPIPRGVFSRIPRRVSDGREMRRCDVSRCQL